MCHKTVCFLINHRQGIIKSVTSIAQFLHLIVQTNYKKLFDGE